MGALRLRAAENGGESLDVNASPIPPFVLDGQRHGDLRTDGVVRLLRRFDALSHRFHRLRRARVLLRGPRCHPGHRHLLSLSLPGGLRRPCRPLWLQTDVSRFRGGDGACIHPARCAKDLLGFPRGLLPRRRRSRDVQTGGDLHRGQDHHRGDRLHGFRDLLHDGQHRRFCRTRRRRHRARLGLEVCLLGLGRVDRRHGHRLHPALQGAAAR